jgi:hypothetical protein
VARFSEVTREHWGVESAPQAHKKEVRSELASVTTQVDHEQGYNPMA